MVKRNDAAAVNLPVRPFLYTLEQVASCIQIDEARLKTAYIWFQGRSIGHHKVTQIRAVNIAPVTPEDPHPKPEWRVSEKEFVRWLNRAGFKVFEKTWE